LAGEADGAWAAAAAKAAAGRAQRTVAASALQVCGALGLTEEFVLHRYVSRAALLDLLYGDHVRLTAALGTALLGGTGRPPALVEIT
jgi:alkylation response protein AidB-like acyl-CoA dehydrogenase